MQFEVRNLPSAGSNCGVNGVSAEFVIEDVILSASAAASFAVHVVVGDGCGSCVGGGVVGGIWLCENKSVAFEVACASNGGCGIRGGRVCRGRVSGGLEKSGSSWEDWLLDLEVDECIGLCNEVGGWGGEFQVHGHIVKTQGCGVPLSASSQCGRFGGCCGDGGELLNDSSGAKIVLDEAREEVTSGLSGIFNSGCSGGCRVGLSYGRRDQESGGKRFHKLN